MVNVALRPLIRTLSPYCQRSLNSSAEACIAAGHSEIAIEHLLLEFLSDQDHDLQIILRHLDIPVSEVSARLLKSVRAFRSGTVERPIYSQHLVDWLKAGWLVASVEYNHTQLRSGVLFLALISDPALRQCIPHIESFHRIPHEKLAQDLSGLFEVSLEKSEQRQVASGAPDARSKAGELDGDLQAFTQNFTEKARQGQIDPVFCRDDEIRQLVDILGRRRKNNPLCVGDAGVGKTALVEGLALRIVDGDVPPGMEEVELLALDLQALQAGASVRGEFENRLKSVVEAVKASVKPVVLFIDEVHTLIGAGGQAGTGDAANILKPALARGELRTIAATTWSEYKQYVESDAALARRFQLVKLDEPTPEQAVTIIRGLRPIYERAHGVYIRDDAVKAAAEMSARYLSGRQLPDKAVDVLDTAGARVKLSLKATPARLDSLRKEIQIVERERSAIERDIATRVTKDDGSVSDLDARLNQLREEAGVLEQQWQREQVCVAKVLELRQQIYGDVDAVVLNKVMQGDAADAADVADAADAAEALEPEGDNNGHDAERNGVTAADPAEPAAAAAAVDAVQSLQTLVAELKEIRRDAPLVSYEVDPEIVAQVISDWTGVPLGRMIQDEASILLNFADLMKERIKGQDAALARVGRSIREAKTGLGNPEAPMGVFFLVGPSGVGKTETALAVADLLFGGDTFLTTINMSEFMEKHTVSRLVGSPPGYVGFKEGGMLTEAVRQRPYSVVLLDEVEKAHPEVMNLFYQVFDKGNLADGESRVVDFSNTVVFMTSNLATDEVMKWYEEGALDVEALEARIRPILSSHFRPALLARMQLIPYAPLPDSVLREITQLKLRKIANRLERNRGIVLSYSDAVVSAIAERCTEVDSGARNVDHVISKSLLPRISTVLLESLAEDSDRPAAKETIVVTLADDGAFEIAVERS